jgi:hypothetical protein
MAKFPIPDEYAQQMKQAYQAEVLQRNQAITTMDPLMFLPAPDNWRQITKLPPAIQKRWADPLLIEIRSLSRKEHLDTKHHFQTTL